MSLVSAENVFRVCVKARQGDKVFPNRAPYRRGRPYSGGGVDTQIV